MKLDRYDTGIPKFRVFRHVEPPAEKVIPNTESGALIRDDDGHWYREVDPWECFVLKRRDLIARLMLVCGSMIATILGELEYGGHLQRLSGEWAQRTNDLSDSKMPD